MAIFLPPVSMIPKPAKTPHLFCAIHSMQKLFLDVTEGERWAVSGPQRAITCKEVFVYSTFEGTHLVGALGFAEAAHTRSAGSPTVRSGTKDAQPPLLFSTNRRLERLNTSKNLSKVSRDQNENEPKNNRMH